MLQHGFTESVMDWYEAGYVEALRSEYRLILIDARGHGTSDKPTIRRAVSAEPKGDGRCRGAGRFDIAKALFGATRWAGGSDLGLPNMPRKEFALW